MRVGTSLTSNHVAADAATGAAQIIERARVAHDVGLDSLSLGDHHVVGSPYYQNTPMLGRLMAEWTSARPIGCLFLMPLWNPVLVAEHIGTLASLTTGPFVVQTGIGHGRRDFAAMGADLRRRGRDTDEAIRVIKALLGGATVTSERFGLEEASFALVPERPVHWWVGAGSAGPLERAAREGDAWYAGPGWSVEQMTELIETFRRACARVGNDTAQVIMRADVIVGADDAAASARADELIAAGYRGMSREGVIAGGVDRVSEIFSAYGGVGVDEIVVRCMNVTQTEAVETLTLCGEIRRHLA